MTKFKHHKTITGDECVLIAHHKFLEEGAPAHPVVEIIVPDADHPGFTMTATLAFPEVPQRDTFFAGFGDLELIEIRRALASEAEAQPEPGVN